ncbi:hypothetical protein [Paenibacillus senegalensis]|uniref:hypothetical protein n=1 Tax=Paenibacillus senegalensis TaxID=1465766 RepID=UPI00028952F1|nr:hypothetical protein [Paenibacillus senegalensis]
MSRIMIRPDMKTAGGETSDIMLDGRFIGALTLVYRENERISGAIQLEDNSFDDSYKEEVEAFITDYIQAFSNSINAPECSVIVTHSSYEHIVNVEEIMEEDEDLDPVLEDEYDDGTEYTAEEDEMQAGYYELVEVNETDNEVEYHVYDEEENWIAEVIVQIDDHYGHGDIHWLHEPSDEEIDGVTELLVFDFDDTEIMSMDIHHFYEGRMLVHMELYAEDEQQELAYEAEDDSEAYDDDQETISGLSNDYSVVLIRDDQDTLTYEIYRQPSGGLPIGTATIDIESRALTGFVDLRQKDIGEETEVIAALLMQELDKEKDYDSLNLTMLHGDEIVEEIMMETENLH